MKAYVMDHGWAGAEIYFSDSRATAVKYFQDKEIALAEATIKQHDVKQSGPMPQMFLNKLEWVNSRQFQDVISEQECVEGHNFWTEGDA